MEKLRLWFHRLLDRLKGKTESAQPMAEDFEPETEYFDEKTEDNPRACYDNRELSWLKFNARVLEEAEDPVNPLCERLSFLSIFQTNLDEFFRVRVGSLYDQMKISEDIRDNKTGMTCREQIYAICRQVKRLTRRRDAAYDVLTEELKMHGVEILDVTKAAGQDAEFLDTYFKKRVKPLLSPQVVGPKQPFPFLNNLDIYVVAELVKKGKDRLGLVLCGSEEIPRLIRIPQHENRYVLSEELILAHVEEIFSQYEIRSRALIRILRNADIDPDEDMYDDDEDFRSIMEQLVNKRRRLKPIKLEYMGDVDSAERKALCAYLKIKKRYSFRCRSPFDLSFFNTVRDILRNEKTLFFKKETPRIPEDINIRRSILEQIREKDRLLYFPYDSMDPFLKMLAEAAVNPDVVSVKMTLYRVAPHSKVVESLIRAAENGKDVEVVVELRARFDEENNIGWSRQLEEAGCSILYGLDNLKIHSKLCLITTREKGRIFYYTQIGTGNYNEETARQYTDMSLLTADQEIGAEAASVFTRLYLGETSGEMKYLLAAPEYLSRPVQEKIDRQISLARAGKPAYVGAKMNSLTDKRLIDKLIEASEAGVKIDLIVRGACCLIAGVPGHTDNIQIRSIVGRYLEHARIYIFGKTEPEVYISSADFMTRNTAHRVEAAAPLLDPEIRERVIQIFGLQMADTAKARIQQPDGSYGKAPAMGEPLNSQEYLTSFVK